jgi:hypothetical protein|tara:strand:- start:57 stop:248 length:192 start_codon:yes stop_codon:yes gene_type:complete
MNIDKIIDIVRNQRLNEMMTVGGGAIAGTVEAGDDPPVKKKRPTILARGKMPGCRKRWKEGIA